MNNRIETCPQCGAPGTAGEVCEYCGAKIPLTRPSVSNPTVSNASTSSNRRIIPFDPDIKEENIKSMVMEKLIDTNYVPLDVFEKMKDFKALKGFFPMYNFVGSFQSSWSCTQVIQVKKERTVYKDGKPKTETYYEKEYHPASGTAAGRFDILCSSDPKLLSADRYDFKNYNNSVPFDESLVDEDAQLVPFEKEQLVSWNTVAKPIIEDLAYSAAYRQAPSPNEQFSQSASWSKEGDGTEVYVPIWLVSYEYDGQTYGAVLRGDRPNHYEITVPKDEDTKKHDNEIRDRKRDIISTLIGIFLLFTVLIATFGFTVYHFSHRWGTFFDFPGIVITLCSAIAIFILCKLYKYMHEGNDKIDAYISVVRECAKLIRSSNAKRYCDYGDADANTSIDLNKFKEPERVSLKWVWTSLIAMAVALTVIAIAIPIYEGAKAQAEQAEWEAQMAEMQAQEELQKKENARKVAKSLKERLTLVQGDRFAIPGTGTRSFLGTGDDPISVELTNYYIMTTTVTEEEWKLLETEDFSTSTAKDFIEKVNAVSSCVFRMPTLMQWMWASEQGSIKAESCRDELCLDLYDDQGLSSGWSDYADLVNPEGPSDDGNMAHSCIYRSNNLMEEGSYNYNVSGYTELSTAKLRLVVMEEEMGNQ